MGDNIDLEVHARIQSVTEHNRSIHWTQEYAIRDKVLGAGLPTQSPQKPMADVQLTDLLPGLTVHENLTYRWAVLVSRVICKYLCKFQHLRNVVINHIEHPYSGEMATKSDTVSFHLKVVLFTHKYCISLSIFDYNILSYNE